MQYCPFCKTDKPFPSLKEDYLRERTNRQLKADHSYWTKEFEKAVDPARHWSHMRGRAKRRIERIEEEMFRRAKNKRANERKEDKAKAEKKAKKEAA